MKHILVAVDLQRDFVSGVLSTPEARKALPKAADLIRSHEGEIFLTLDTHEKNYLETKEGKNLPVEHCIRGTRGWELEDAITEALRGKEYTLVQKPTFGSEKLVDLIRSSVGEEEFDLLVFGVCTDICVVSNALLLKAAFPEKEIRVDARASAGVTPELHAAALSTMRSCQIEIIE